MSYAQPISFSQPAAAKQGHQIRAAATGDLEKVVTIHQKSFPNSFLTDLGRAFLRRYYDLVLGYRGGVLLVNAGCTQVEGFVCGFVDPKEFYELMRQKKTRFALPILLAMARHPTLAGKIVNGMQRVDEQTEKEAYRSCELSSLAVLPELRGRGAGRALIRAFLEQAHSMGVQHVYLSTDADDNGPANALYQKAGFQIRRRYPQYKQRWMNEYIFDLPSGNA